jgi:general secretion pathway protein D
MRSHFLSALYAGLLLLTPPLLKADLIAVGFTSVSVGTSFDLPVTISGTSDLYAFQFDVSYDPSILQLNSILEGSFLSSAGPTFFIPGTIDNTLGIATFTADALFGATGAAGTGTLATLDFQAVAGGVSALDLSNVILLDSNLNDISFTAQSGQAVVSAVPEPDSIWLLASGISLCLFLRKRLSLQ